MAEAQNDQRGLRKKRRGTVVSRSGDKSVKVRVSRRKRHPLYGKEVTVSRHFHAHDEENRAQVGDIVVLHETRPISKLKRWRVAEVIPAGTVAE